MELLAACVGGGLSGLTADVDVEAEKEDWGLEFSSLTSLDLFEAEEVEKKDTGFSCLFGPAEAEEKNAVML